MKEQEGRTKKLQEGKKRLSETQDHEKQRLATLKRLKRGDENELERKLRLEKVVASKWLRLAMERKKRKTGHGDGQRKKSKTGEDGSYHTAQGLETEEEERKAIWFTKTKLSRNKIACPVIGTIFLVNVV